MKIEEIPADEVVEMTPLFHRAFSAVGCNPHCHCCWKELPIGSMFKLATMEPGTSGFARGHDKPTDVMLCKKCTPKKFAKQTKEEYEAKQKAGGGCFRINGKIVM